MGTAATGVAFVIARGEFLSSVWAGRLQLQRRVSFDFLAEGFNSVPVKLSVDGLKAIVSSSLSIRPPANPVITATVSYSLLL